MIKRGVATAALVGGLIIVPAAESHAMVTPTVKVWKHTIRVTTQTDQECSSFSVNVVRGHNVREMESTTGSVWFRGLARHKVYEVYVWALCPNGGASDTWLALDTYVRTK